MNRPTHPSCHGDRGAVRTSSIPIAFVGRELHRISVDLTRIDGIDVGVAQTMISEVGLDMSRWEDEDHFASWLGLCPDNRITGPDTSSIERPPHYGWRPRRSSGAGVISAPSVAASAADSAHRKR